MGRQIRKISSRIFTLTYPKYRFFIFLIVLILLAILPINIVEKTHEFSVCSKVLGKYCFSVGITRGVSSLLKGNFTNALNYNFLSIPVLILMFGFLINDFFKGFIKNKG